MRTRRWLAILAGVAMALGLGVTAQPSEAVSEVSEIVEVPSHNPQGDHWAWVCLAARPDENPDIEHAHVTLMATNHVRVYCQGDTPSGLRECTWHAIEWKDGPVTGPYGPTPYCELNTDGLAGVQMSRGSPTRPTHNPNSYAFWACGGSRIGSNHIVGHSVPISYGPGGSYLYVYCWSSLLNGVEPVQWYALLWWNGEISVVGGSEGWHFCQYEYCSPEP